MKTRLLEKSDYDHVVQVIDRWWGGPTSALAHPIFFHELGDLARVAEEDGQTVGFLLGFVASSAHSEGQVGYIHLVGIHPEFRRRGVGRLLYETFERDCASVGVTRLKAITNFGNEGSQRFHASLGWKSVELSDYAGPGRGRIVFTKGFDLRAVTAGGGAPKADAGAGAK
jgi:GNAT superfamily N-acetyltransferase